MPVGQFVLPAMDSDRELEAQGFDSLEPSSQLRNWAAGQLGMMSNPAEMLRRHLELKDLKDGRSSPTRGEDDLGGTDITYNDLPSRMLDPEEANKLYARPGMTAFKAPIRERAARRMAELQEERNYLNSIVERSNGWGYGAAVAHEFAVGAVDPINVATAFIPFTKMVPFLRGLPVLAEQGASIGSRVLGRTATGAIEGGLGQAIMEPGMAYLSLEEQQDYTMGQSLMNIAFGSALGAGLHNALPPLYQVAQKTPEWLRGLKSSTVHSAQEIATHQLAAGQIPEVDAIVRSDPGIVAKDTAPVLDLDFTAKPTVEPTKPPEIIAAENLAATSQRTSGISFDKAMELFGENFSKAVETFAPYLKHPKGAVEFLVGGVKLSGKQFPINVDGIELNGVKFVREDFIQHPHQKIQGELPFLKDKVLKLDNSNNKVSIGNLVVEKDGRIWLSVKDGKYVLPTWSDSAEPGQALAQMAANEHLGLNVRPVEYLKGIIHNKNNFQIYVSERTGGLPKDAVLMTPDQLKGHVEPGSVEASVIKAFEKKKYDQLKALFGNSAHVPKEAVAAMNDKGITGNASEPSVFRSMDQFELVDPQALGSNQGGLYRDKFSGELWYIKQYKEKSQAKTEYLANSLYRMAHESVPSDSIKFPEAELILDGFKIHVGTKFEKDVKIGMPTDLKSKLALKDDFILDAWLGNWDVLVHGNVGTLPDGSVLKLDQGGALEYRAQGEKKSNFGSQVEELSSLRDHNPLFKELSEAQKAVGLQRLLSISHDEIKAAVAAAGFSAQDADHLASILIARQEYIAAQYPSLTKTLMSTMKGIRSLIAKQDAKNYIKSKIEQLWDKYTAPEKHAIEDYQGGSYALNNFLRNGGTGNGYNELIKSLDSAAEKYSLSVDTILYRWIATDNFRIGGQAINSKNYQQFVGARGTDKGYMSTMLAKFGSFHGTTNLELVIKAPAGVKGIIANVVTKSHNFADEVEFITQRGLNYTVSSVVEVSPGKFQAVLVVDHPSSLTKATKEDYIKAMKEKMDKTSSAADDSPIPDAEAIAKQVDDLLIPTLTDVAESKFQKVLTEEIADLEKNLRVAMKDSDALSSIFDDIGKAEKETNSFIDAINAGWTCYRGS